MDNDASAHMLQAISDAFRAALQFFGEEKIAEAHKAFGYEPPRHERTFFFRYIFFHLKIHKELSILEWVESFQGSTPLWNAFLKEPYSVYGRTNKPGFLKDLLRGVSRKVASTREPGKCIFAKIVEWKGEEFVFTVSPRQHSNKRAQEICSLFLKSLPGPGLLNSALLNHDNARRLFLLWHEPNYFWGESSRGTSNGRYQSGD